MVKLNTKFNKILAVMLSLLIIFAAFGNIIPYMVQAEEADSDVIVISSAKELIEFANNCKYDSYSRGRTGSATGSLSCRAYTRTSPERPATATRECSISPTRVSARIC